MANKRDLKKQVRYICGDLASECMLAADYVKGVDRTTMQKIVSEIARLQTATLANMSFAFDKVPSDFDNGATYTKERLAYNRKAFNALRAKFNSRVQEIVKDMNAALPQAVKDANKAH